VNGKIDTAATLGNNTFNITDKPPFNTTINYTVLAIDSTGNVSEASNSISAFVKIIKAVEEISDFDLTSNVDSNTVQLKWEVKNATELKGFVVYRTLKGVNSWMPISSLLKEGNYADSSVKKLKSYEYQIRTYAQNGQVSISPSKSITVQ
jgi:two-component SAPR family response regulator